jgi:hypothetical protein
METILRCDSISQVWQYLAGVTVSRSILLEVRTVLDKVLEKKSKHTFCVQYLSFRKTCRLWGNVEKFGGAGQATYNNTTLPMRFACWITKATDTLRMCNTYCLSTAAMVTWRCPSVTFYVRCLSYVYSRKFWSSWIYGLWWNLIFDTFSKICRGNSNCIKIRQKWRVPYMKTFRHFWRYLAKFLLQWEVF